MLTFKRFIDERQIQNAIIDTRPPTAGTCTFCGERAKVSLVKLEYAREDADWALVCLGCWPGGDCDDVGTELAAEVLRHMGGME